MAIKRVTGIKRATIEMEYSRCRRYSDFCKAMLPRLRHGARIHYTEAMVEYVMANPELAESIARLAVEMQLPPKEPDGDQLGIAFGENAPAA